MLALQMEAESRPEEFKSVAEVAGAIWKDYNGIIAIPLNRLVGELM